MSHKTLKYRLFLKRRIAEGMIDQKQLLLEFRNQFGTSDRTFFRHFKEAKQQFYNNVKESEAKVDEKLTTEVLVSRLSPSILNRIDRLRIASEIAIGITEATVNERLKALDYLSKVEGDYSISESTTINPVVLSFNPLALPPEEIETIQD